MDGQEEPMVDLRTGSTKNLSRLAVKILYVLLCGVLGLVAGVSLFSFYGSHFGWQGPHGYGGIWYVLLGLFFGPLAGLLVGFWGLRKLSQRGRFTLVLGLLALIGLSALLHLAFDPKY